MTKTEDTSMRVLKTANCKTISGKSTLTYQVSVNQDDAIYIRITGNYGGGFHSNENVAFDDILEALKDDSKGAAITSIRLTNLFKGKSVNTPSFLLATLKDLKLVRPMQGKQRHHEQLDPRPFLEMVNQLMASEGNTAGATRKAPTKKATVKKCAAASSTKASTNKSSTA